MVQENDLLSGLNPEQVRAVRHENGPLLILAGAGAGKTAVMTRRAARLVRLGHDPSRLMVVTFTNKASNELKERCEGLLGPAARRVRAGTFHSLIIRTILRPAAEADILREMGLSGRFAILDNDGSERLFRAAWKERGSPEVDHFEKIGRGLAECRRLIGAVRSAGHDFMIEGKTIRTALSQQIAKSGFSPDATNTSVVVMDLWSRYHAACRDLNACDFDGILTLGAWLMRERHDFAASRAAMFSFLEVDEYQDTNPVQSQIVEALAAPHGNLAVCGDDRQAIYGFRGSDVRVIREFHTRHPDVTVVDLCMNYRSTPPIIETANACARAMPDRLSDTDMLPAAGAAGQSVHPVGMFYPTDREEACGVAEELLEAHKGGIGWNALAVLYRARSLKEPLEAELVRARVPFVVVGDTGFFDHVEVKDIAAMIRVLVNPEDRPGWVRVLGAGGFGVTPEAFSKSIKTHGSAVNTLNTLVSGRIKSTLKLRSLLTQVERFTRERDTINPDIGALVDGVVLEASRPTTFHEYLMTLWNHYLMPSLKADIDRQMKKQFQVNRGGASRRDQMTAFAMEERTARADVVAGWVASRRENQEPWDEILDGLSLQDATEDKDRDAVKLMTVHAAKGLEFERVWYLGGADDDPDQMKSDSDMAEERRVFYVALTRAKRMLSVTGAAQRKRYGQIKVRRRSGFFEEVMATIRAEERGQAVA